MGNEDTWVLHCNGLAVDATTASLQAAESAPSTKSGGLFDDLPDTVAGPNLPAVGQVDNSCLVAVLDGHGGAAAARLCAQRLAVELHEQLEASARDTAEARKLAAEEVFFALDRHLRVKLGPSACSYCGSTCVFCFAWLDDDSPGKFGLLVANLGDSRALVLRTSEGDLKLHSATTDHKPEAPAESERIRVAGGKVGLNPDDPGQKARVDCQLGCSRALGDFAYKEDAALLPEEQKVSNKPDIYEFLCDFGDAVVLASDGAMDVLSSEKVAAIVARELRRTDDPAVAAKAVVKAALADPSQEDNCTCVVFRT